MESESVTKQRIVSSNCTNYEINSKIPSGLFESILKFRIINFQLAYMLTQYDKITSFFDAVHTTVNLHK